FARVGLMGNPSDGFFGKTISLLIKNFDATVTLSPNSSPSELTIRIDPSPVLDPYLFASMPTLRVACEKDGYYGIHRLILATLHLFARTCAHENINLDTRRGFRVSYATNIPRQVGLAGSSAMVTALLRALLHYYALESHAAFPLHARADLAWRVEKEELGIASGLQDRVVQAYGGLVYMDFGREWMEARGYGVYERLPVEWAPKELWIAYVGAPSDSGKIHSDVRARFFAGDEEVVNAMSHFADLATRAREALQHGDSRKFAELMENNFSTRRSVYGDAVVGATNLAVVKVAREFGHAAKFSGSGGCVVGLWRGEEGMESVEGRREMVRRIRGFGYVF
ncbi:ribosomal protein S5 domain 2-type protein, partial [Chytriomyces sp. MP71]